MRSKSVRFLLLALAFLAIGCSTDENPVISTVDNPKLLKKTTQELYDGDMSITNTMDYQYVNGILELVVENGWLKSEFTYDGQKVTQASVYQSGVFKEHVDFFYNANQLSYTLADGENNPEKMAFFYEGQNLTGLVRSYLLNGETFVPFVSKEFTFQNGNVTAYASTWDEVSLTTDVDYQYDLKNNPARNMNPYLRLYLAKDNPNGLSGNNFLEAWVTNEDHPTVHYNFETIYEDDYPIDIKQYTDDGTMVMHMILEYY